MDSNVCQLNLKSVSLKIKPLYFIAMYCNGSIFNKTDFRNKEIVHLLVKFIYSEKAHKILQNIHLTFVLCRASQKKGEDFALVGYKFILVIAFEKYL